MSIITGEVNDIASILSILEGKYDKAGGLISGDVSIDGDFLLVNTQWDDMRFPFIGRNVDTSTGRIDYNYEEICIDYAQNALLDATTQVSMICQFSHSWNYGEIFPHLHWYQSSPLMPNWLIGYRWIENGDQLNPVFTYITYGDNKFPYTSGKIAQITDFDIPVPASIDTTSAILDLKFWRDSTNISGLFPGNDPLSEIAQVKEFDIHYQKNSLGSNTEYIK